MRWEYAIVDVEYSEKQKRWLAWYSGQQHRHLELLNQMGDDGWELVGMAVARDYVGGGSPGFPDQWYSPSHSLYFKRPKP